MTPASSATARTSPFVPPPSMTRLMVSCDMATAASATARRAVIGLADTSTIRGRPARSTWDSRRRSARGCGLDSIGPPGGRRVRRWPPSCPVEPPERDLGAGRERVVGFGDDRQGIGGGERRDDVTPLPAREVDGNAARPSRIGAPVSSRAASTRMNARRPWLLDTGSPSTPRSTGRSRSWRPASARIAGRTNSSKVTADETGLPGRPNRRTGVPPPGRSAVPNANGLPGWTATRQRSMRPMVSMAVLTTS